MLQPTLQQHGVIPKSIMLQQGNNDISSDDYAMASLQWSGESITLFFIIAESSMYLLSTCQSEVNIPPDPSDFEVEYFILLFF